MDSTDSSEADIPFRAKMVHKPAPISIIYRFLVTELYFLIGSVCRVKRLMFGIKLPDARR